jgi:hypothetical protein
VISNGLTIIRARRWRVQKSREIDALWIWVHSVVVTIQTYGGTALGMSEEVPKPQISTRYLFDFEISIYRHATFILFDYYSLSRRGRGIHVEMLPGLCSPMKTSAIYA